MHKQSAPTLKCASIVNEWIHFECVVRKKRGELPKTSEEEEAINGSKMVDKIGHYSRPFTIYWLDIWSSSKTQ